MQHNINPSKPLCVEVLDGWKVISRPRLGFEGNIQHGDLCPPPLIWVKHHEPQGSDADRFASPRLCAIAGEPWPQKFKTEKAAPPNQLI